MKATAIAHPIQGLIKYHGLKDPELRIPFHDSISVCIKELKTTTTVKVDEKLDENIIIINGRKVRGREKARVERVLNEIKKKADYKGYFRAISENSVKLGKGLGFSASGFAALGLAASKALNLKIDYITLSEIVRLGAGSATRSLAGGFSIWYANKNGQSYAEPLKYPSNIDFAMIIIPIQSEVRTDEAHSEVLSSPLFKARLKSIGKMIEEMKATIKRGDTATIGRLAEEDTLNLHATTMTGKSHMILWKPETLKIIHEVIKMRKKGIEAWYSIDTGPSVFINTYQSNIEKIAKRLREIGFTKIIISQIGGKPKITNKHLF